jgi:hypothetical protein
MRRGVEFLIATGQFPAACCGEIHLGNDFSAQFALESDGYRQKNLHPSMLDCITLHPGYMSDLQVHEFPAPVCRGKVRKGALRISAWPEALATL